MTDQFDFNEALEAEWDSHLADDVAPDRKNGKSGKTIKTSEGKVDLDTPRDRAGIFESQITQKHQTSVSDAVFVKVVEDFVDVWPWPELLGYPRACR